MDLKNLAPIVIYDNECYLCIKFANFVRFFARGKVLLVGHYSSLGEKLRSEFLDSSALEMFWFIDEKMAFGGRAALFPLFKVIFSNKKNDKKNQNEENLCDVGCKNTKAVFVRSASLLRKSKKIKIKS